MRCPEAFDAMLVADPAALRGDGESPLAVHVRGCAECRRAAARIGRGTDALAGALAERRAVGRRRWRTGWTVAWPAVAAALLLVVVLRHRSVAAPSMPSTRLAAGADSVDRGRLGPDAMRAIEESIRSAVPVAQISSLGDSPRDVQLQSQADESTTSDSVGVPELLPDSVTASGSTAGAVVPEPAVVAVRAAPGHRVAILRTADPTVTLVWLY